jgi:hypothetical protein
VGTVRRQLTTPLLAPLMRSRALIWALLAAAGLQCALTRFGLPGWPCPLLQATGVPCPGCGLTRATLALLGGEWRASLTLHAFAPILALALLLLGGGLLPSAPRRRLIDHVEKLERRTGVTGLLAVALVAYWLVRLAFFRESFVRLVGG